MAFQRKELSSPRILDFSKGFLLKLKTALDAIFALKVHDHPEYVKKTEVSSYVSVSAPDWNNCYASFATSKLVTGVTVTKDGFVRIIMTGVGGHEIAVLFNINGVNVSWAGFNQGNWRSDTYDLFPVKKGDVIKVTGQYGAFNCYAYLYTAR